MWLLSTNGAWKTQSYNMVWKNEISQFQIFGMEFIEVPGMIALLGDVTACLVSVILVIWYCYIGFHANCLRLIRECLFYRVALTQLVCNIL